MKGGLPGPYAPNVKHGYDVLPTVTVRDRVRGPYTQSNKID